MIPTANNQQSSLDTGSDSNLVIRASVTWIILFTGGTGWFGFSLVSHFLYANEFLLEFWIGLLYRAALLLVFLFGFVSLVVHPIIKIDQNGIFVSKPFSMRGDYFQWEIVKSIYLDSAKLLILVKADGSAIQMALTYASKNDRETFRHWLISRSKTLGDSIEVRTRS